MTAWLFGKMPAHGDFVSRGLGPTMRDRLDLWLSAEMDVARAEFGDEFEPRYDARAALVLRRPNRTGNGTAGRCAPRSMRPGAAFR